MSWLLVAANNYLRQQQPDRAAILLEFLGLLDPHNLQSQKMLAYAHWQQGDAQRCAAIVARLLRQPLSEEDRAAMEIMKQRIVGAVRGQNAKKPPTRPD